MPWRQRRSFKEWTGSFVLMIGKEKTSHQKPHGAAAERPWFLQRNGVFTIRHKRHEPL